MHSSGETKVIAESDAIMAYIVAAHGTSSGMQRTDPMDIAQVEEIYSVLSALSDKLSATIWEPDMEKKLACRKVMVETTIPE